MKICYLIPKLEPSDAGVFVGGSVNALLTLLQSLRNMVSAVLLTSARNGSASLVRRHCTNVDELVLVTNDMPPQSFSFGFLYLLKSFIWAIRNRGKGIAITHGHSGYAIYAWATHLIGAVLRTKTIHTVYCPLTKQGTVVSRRNVFLRARLASVALKRMDHIIAMSSNIRDSLIAAGIQPSKITAIPNAVDVDKYRPRSDNYRVRRTLEIGEEDPIILFVGNLTQSKGLDVLITAMKQVVSEFPTTKLIVTLELRHSSFDERERALADQIAELNLQDNIIQLSIIDYMPELLSSIDIAVSPYRDTQGPSDYPLALMEAMASGRCVVGTRTGGLPELIDNEINGILVEPGEATVLSEALLRLLRQPALRSKIGSTARTTVMKRFASDQVAERHLQVYSSVLARIDKRRH